MTKEQLDKIFEYLEKEANKQGLFYFTFEGGNVNAKFKSNNKTFAQFYPKQILKIINGDYGNVGFKGE